MRKVMDKNTGEERELPEMQLPDTPLPKQEESSMSTQSKKMSSKQEKWYRVEYLTTIEPPKKLNDVNRLMPTGKGKVDDFKVFELTNESPVVIPAIANGTRATGEEKAECVCGAYYCPAHGKMTSGVRQEDSKAIEENVKDKLIEGWEAEVASLLVKGITTKLSWSEVTEQILNLIASQKRELEENVNKRFEELKIKKPKDISAIRWNGIMEYTKTDVLSLIKGGKEE